MIMKCLVKEPLGSVRHKSFIKHPGNKHSYEQAFSGKLCMPVLLSGNITAIITAITLTVDCL